MRLNVSDIPDEGLQQEVDLPIRVNDSAEPDMAHVSIKVLRFGKKVLLDGSIKVTAKLTCSRCLKDFSLPLDLDFRDEYNPPEEIEQEKSLELSGSELDLSYYMNDEIDISEVVQEQVMLNIPMKTVCQAECKGICTGCGTDLNEEACMCKEKEIDPRLAPLNKLEAIMKDRGSN